MAPLFQLESSSVSLRVLVVDPTMFHLVFSPIRVIICGLDQNILEDTARLKYQCIIVDMTISLIRILLALSLRTQLVYSRHDYYSR